MKRTAFAVAAVALIISQLAHSADLPSAPGIYYDDGTAFREVPQAGVAKVKSSGIPGLGAKSAEARLSGFAKFEIADPKPAFVIVDANPGRMFFVRTIPGTDCRLVKMLPSQLFNGRKLWVAEDQLIEGRVEPVGNGTFRLQPPAVLEPGEYTIEYLNSLQGVRRTKDGGEFRVIGEATNPADTRPVVPFELSDADFAATRESSALDRKNGFQEFVFGSAPSEKYVAIKIPRIHALKGNRDQAIAASQGGIVVGGARSEDWARFAGSFTTLPGPNTTGLWTEFVSDPAAKSSLLQRAGRMISLSPDEVVVMTDGRNDHTIQGVVSRHLGLNYVGGRLAAIRFDIASADVDRLTRIFEEAYGAPRRTGSACTWAGRHVELEVSINGQVLMKSRVMLEAIAGYRGGPAKSEMQKMQDL